jgi:hypothetical protein
VASNTSVAAQPRSTGMKRYPLRPDGSPDFEKYLLNSYREGATPENNAAVLMFQVLWPEMQHLLEHDGDEVVLSDGRKRPVMDVMADDYGAVYRELGLPGVPAKANVLRSAYGEASRQRVKQWMAGRGARRPPAAARGSFAQMYSSEEDRFIDPTITHPWTSAALPPIAEWVRENERALDQIVAATRRPRLYGPSASLLNDVDEPVMAMLLPHAQEMRNVARGLSARAMWHLGEGRLDKAWQDILAMHNLARLMDQQLTLVEQLVASAIDGMACNATIALLTNEKATAATARDVLRDLANLPPFQGMARSFDTAERAMCLDIVLRVKSGNTYSKEMEGYLLDLIGNLGSTNTNEIKGLDRGMTSAAQQVTEWNAVYWKINDIFDRCVAVARMPPGVVRRKAIDQIESELSDKRVRDSVHNQLRTFSRLTPENRSSVFASVMIMLLTPSTKNALAAQDRANAVLDMTRLAAALAAFRAERGQYPDKLDDLVPGVLPKLPADAFNDKAFVYRKEGNGYLLYSLGANGNDDAGVGPVAIARDFQEGMNDAQRQAHQAKTRAGADDVSLQLPLPAFDWNLLLSPN